MSILKNKKVLITAGPTWVPIDSVRVISNTATGQTGVLLADKLAKAGAKVTLLLGPQDACCLSDKIRVIRFKFFKELSEKITGELKKSRYDVLIHSAAVSDYEPISPGKGKIKSGIKNLKISLKPTPKIIDRINKVSPGILVVGFKYKPQARKESLISESRRLALRSGSDLVVANTFNKDKYRAYIVNGMVTYGLLSSKKDMAGKLIKLIGERLCRN